MSTENEKGFCNSCGFNHANCICRTDAPASWTSKATVELSSPPRYLLQNNSAGYVGNSPQFWHASDSGYTQWVDEAKRWTKEEAEQQIRSTRGTHSWTMWTEEEIYTVAKRTVDVQDLRRIEG